MNRYSIDGIVTCYLFDGSEIEYQRRRNFSHRSRQFQKSTHPPAQSVNHLFPERKNGWGVALTTHSPLASRLKKDQRCTSTPLRSSMACSRVTFLFTLHYKWENIWKTTLRWRKLQISLTYIFWESVKRIYLAEGRKKWPNLVNTIMNIRVQ